MLERRCPNLRPARGQKWQSALARVRLCGCSQCLAMITLLRAGVRVGLFSGASTLEMIGFLRGPSGSGLFVTASQLRVSDGG